MKSILVTGATGFIGSRLVTALIEKNIQFPLLLGMENIHKKRQMKL